MLAGSLILLSYYCLGQVAAPVSIPVRLGVDDAGGHLTTFHKLPTECPAYFRALDDLGARFVSIHLLPVTNAGVQNPVKTRERIERMDQAMRDHHLDYSLNVELSNFIPRLEITPGINEFERPGGTHRWDLRMDWISAVLPPARPGQPALIAVTYDECEHMILSNNKFSNSPKASFDQPFLVNTNGLPLTTAYDRLVAEARRLRTEHYENRIRPQSEQVWPDLFHIFARAGWTITPKLLKENIASVVMSIALGAAIQYQDAGTCLWASPDLWNWDRYPGHSPAALRSALMTAYWLGAETIYVENMDLHKWPKRHPQASPEGSLVHWTSEDKYEITPHGRVVSDFYRNYVPNHPRTIDWRNYDPRVAIIRLPDGGWGQFTPRSPAEGEPASRNRLLGNKQMPIDAAAAEWLQVWPILTHGAARPGCISAGNPFVYPKQIEQFFAPIDSVAVFDHNVEAARLANVDCLIVCGHALSAQTFNAIRARVASGATCIIARRLYALFASTPLPGDWLIVDDFKDTRIAAKLAPFLGPPDVARFRFRHQVVEFRQTGQPDAIDIRVIERN